MTPYEERLCRTCKYGKKPEYYKPCGALYRDDCRLYEPIEEMTLKKAIIQLEYLKNNGFKTKEQFEALDLVIKALEQKLCEDCISREEAINAVHKYFVKYLKINDDICLDGIRSLPSVTPQPKKGKWIVIRKEYKFMGSVVNEAQGCECSNCDGIVKLKSDFCPNCGAKMESEDTE